MQKKIKVKKNIVVFVLLTRFNHAFVVKIWFFSSYFDGNGKNREKKINKLNRILNRMQLFAIVFVTM